MSDPPIRRLLSPSNCPRCEYALAGLGGRTCPECGYTYDERTVYLCGYDRFQADARKRSRRWVILQWMVFAAFAIFLIGTARRTNDWIMVALIACVGVRQWWWRAGDHGALLIQVRLSADGFVQVKRQHGPIPFEKADAAIPMPWSAADEVDIRSLGDDRVSIQITVPRNRSDVPWWRLDRGGLYAEIICTEAERQLILSRIATWRRTATPVHHGDMEDTEDKCG